MVATTKLGACLSPFLSQRRKSRRGPAAASGAFGDAVRVAYARGADPGHAGAGFSMTPQDWP